MAKGRRTAVAAYTPLLSLLLAVALFSQLQVTECARPSPEESMVPAVPHPILHDAAGDTGAQPTGAEAAEGTAAGAAPSTATAAPARDEVGHPADGVVETRNSGGVLMMRPRRFLSGAPPVEGGADSAARPSCQTSDPHVGCAPPSHK